ncbi:MAG: 1-acyl-sn-glycerol-3-phosphate acyltransferase [Anaerolineae bacterium]|nr:1-acyl-sn-glycerol-3-phosphate acyltransferase [Anaerolineae bacterium]
MVNRVQYYYRRQALRTLGRVGQALLTRTTVTGKEYIPASGPYIAVGNHVAAMEVALMVVNLPHIPELVGNGDIPFDPTFKFMASWYRFIPVRRGYVDRAALEAARNVLSSGHVLGAFPEGGIWDHRIRSARPGVAWLSQQTGVPILPIGFGGVLGALGKTLRLKRPRLSVNIGPVIPPVPNPASRRARKEAVQEASAEIMRRISALVPGTTTQDDLLQEEHYNFRVELNDPDGVPVTLDDRLVIPYGEDLSYYFHRYVLLEVVYRNFKLTGAKPLSMYPELTDPVKLGTALDVALDFYEREPVFLSYRLGYQRADHVMQGLRGLREALSWAAVQGYEMRLLPERTIMLGGETQTFISPSVKREY